MPDPIDHNLADGEEGDSPSQAPKSAPKKVAKRRPAAHHAPPSEAVKPKNRRDGIVTGKAGEPAQLQGGEKTAAPHFNPAEVAELLDMWWIDGDGDKFLVKTDRGWSKWPKSMVNKKMRLIPGRMIALKPRDGEAASEADRVLVHTMEERSLTHALPGLAGHDAGVYKMNGENVMVLRSDEKIKPIAPMLPRNREPWGDWPTVRDLIHGRLGDEQSRFFHSWLKVAYQSLIFGGPGNFQGGHALIFAGGAGSGKSRLQHQIITPMLGNRSADPGPFMFGRTDFNPEMIPAAHLLMEDPQSTTLTKDRVYFGEMIKSIVANDEHRLHPKGKDAVMGHPFWRLTISINDDPDKMRVLPLITPDIIGKLMMFKVQEGPLPMPTATLDERRSFRDAIAEELPYYAHWLLNEWEIPEDIREDRWGVKHYQDPVLLGDLFDDTPASELLNLIDAAEFTCINNEFSKARLWDIPKGDLNHTDKKMLWHHRAVTLESLLTGEIDGVVCSVSAKARQFFRHNNCGRLLGRLRNDSPDRVIKHNITAFKGWAIAG